MGRPYRRSRPRRARPEDRTDDGGVRERLCVGGSASSRAAIRVRTVSGALSASRRPAPCGALLSTRKRASSSANSGLPPQRSAALAETCGASAAAASATARRDDSCGPSAFRSSLDSRRPALGSPGAPRGTQAGPSRPAAAARRRPADEVSEELERRLARPVQVLDDDDRRTRVGDALDEPRPRGEVLVSRRSAAPAGPGARGGSSRASRRHRRRRLPHAASAPTTSSPSPAETPA